MKENFFKGFEKKAIKMMKMVNPIRKGMGPGMNIGQNIKSVASKSLKQIKV